MTMLHALMPAGEEIPVEARAVAALLDQFELHVARICQRDRHLYIVYSVAVAELGQLY